MACGGRLISPSGIGASPAAEPGSAAPFSPLLRLPMALLALASLLLVAWVGWSCRYGVEFTDEGVYLNAIAHPQRFSATVTQYGFVYHPFYRLVGGDVVLLRQGNLLITQALAWLLFLLLLRGRGTPRSSLPAGSIVVLSLALSTAALTFHYLWLPTPNYNGLTLQALLLAGIGLVLADARVTCVSIGGWVAIGLAGCVIFLAKPTSAAALALAMALVLPAAGKFNLRLGGLSVLVCLVAWVGAAFLIDGSVSQFVARLSAGVSDASLLKGGHSWSQSLRFGELSLGPPERIIFTGIAIGVAVMVTFQVAVASVTAQAVATVLILAGLAAYFLVPGWLESRGFGGQFGGLHGAASLVGTALEVLISRRRVARERAFRQPLALAAVFALFPWVFVFGTNANYWEMQPLAAVFWVAAAACLLQALPVPLAGRALVPLAVVTLAVTFRLVAHSVNRPYRQTAPLHEAGSRVGSQERLRVLAPTSTYIGELSGLAKAHGFKPGDPVLDLTGRYPAALFLMEAAPVASPWLCGGYPGSEAVAVAALDRVGAAELAQMWILVEPGGPRSFDPAFLRRYGIEVARDYRSVGAVSAPTDVPGERVQQWLLQRALP
jgi:hypothetical protein